MSQTNLKPLIGEQAIYFPAPDDPGAHLSTDPHAATVAGVNEEDGTVNLAVLDSFGQAYQVQRVALILDAEPALTPEYRYARLRFQFIPTLGAFEPLPEQAEEVAEEVDDDL